MARTRQISDEDVLDIAREVFTSGGPSTSTAVVAAKAGLSQAALFKRFGTKERLLLQAFPVPTAEWLRLLDSGPTNLPCRDQLQAIGREVFAFFQTVVPRIAVLRGCGMAMPQIFADEPTPPPMRAQRALAAWFREAIARRLIRPADPDVLAFAFLGPFQSRAFWQHMAGPAMHPIPDEVYVTSVLDVFWRGVAPEDSDAD